MIKVDLNNLNLDQQLRINLESATNEVRRIAGLQQKYAYIDSHDRLWHAVFDSLTLLTNNNESDCKCWYCECDGSAGFSFHVDHFRPKNRVKRKKSKKDEFEPGYWWLAFSPANYRIACQRCNSGSGKNDQFPLADGSPRAIFEGGERDEISLLLDPNSDDPRLLMFSEDGDVRAASTCLDHEKKRVEISIEVYDLKARSKRVGRRKVWRDCRNAINDAREARQRLAEALLSPDGERNILRNNYSHACLKINKMALPNAKFSSTAKSCVKEYYKFERNMAILENREFDLDWLLDCI